MGAAVSLDVQPGDVDGADFLNVGRQQVDFGANQVGNLLGLFPAQVADLNGAGGGHFGVGPFRDFLSEGGAHLFQLKIHPGRAGAHIAAGNLGSIIPPDHAAKDVQGGMGSHQPIAMFPIDAAGDRRAAGRQIAVDAVDNFTLDPAHPGNGILLTGGIGQYAHIAGLPAAANIKGGAIQFHAAVDHRRNGRGKLPQVGIGMKEQFGHRKSPRPSAIRLLPDIAGRLL